MAQPKKLSGAALAAQLSVLPTFAGPQADAAIEAEPAAPKPTNADTPAAPNSTAVQHASPLVSPTFSQPRRPQGGRPSKAGVDGIPLNVRLSQRDHLALARLAGSLLVPGRPMPTVQDVVRGLIRGALQEPDAALRLIQQAEPS